MWQVVPVLYKDALVRAQFVEILNGVQIWNLNDCYYLMKDEKFTQMWSEMFYDVDMARREAIRV